MTASHELETKPETIYLGTLKDFGLGNPEGIPSDLAEATDAERMEYVKKLEQTVADVTDHSHFSCIDGRCRICNVDESQPEVRRHQTGAGASVENAMYSQAPVLDTLDSDTSIGTVVNTIETYVEDAMGVKRASHRGGCGSAGGAKKHAEAVATKTAILDATEMIMNHPKVASLSKIPFTQTTRDTVREGAGMTAAWMESKGWDGERYTDGVVKDEPAGVEDLQTADDKFRGHEEPGTVLVYSRSGKKTLSEAKMLELGVNIPFITNLDASVEEAKALGGARGEQGVSNALGANLAKHLAVDDALTHPDSPLFLMVID